METTEVAETREESFPIGEPVSETRCVHCNRDFPSRAALLMHKRWAHSEEGRKAMLSGVRRAGKARERKNRLPKLIGKIPQESKVLLGGQEDCGFCGRHFNSNSGLRYHLQSQHNGKSMLQNRVALQNKKFAKPPRRLDQLVKPVAPMANGLIGSSEVVATIEVLRVGKEVYGRITSEVSAS